MELQRYSLERKLAPGKLGEAWLATDTQANRRVIVKFLHAAVTPEATEISKAAVESLINLEHPNIATIYDVSFDSQEGKFYVVTEYAAGESLATFIAKQGTLSSQTTLNMALNILRGLEHAHRQNIFHLDLKPANIIINNGRLKLTDFGLAGLISQLPGQSGPIFANPNYISPEQAEARAIDGRADLYALGVILFEIISGGQLPFEHTDETMLLRAHMYAPPPSIRSFNPNVSLVLERTIMRLLSKSPRSRYASADVVISILESIHTTEKQPPRPRPAPGPKETALVGRTDELKTIKAAWARIQQSTQPALLVLHGEMGVGKNRLIAEFTDKNNILTLQGRCDEFGVPYAPFNEILSKIFETNLIDPATVVAQIEPILNQIPLLKPLLTPHRLPATDQYNGTPQLTQWQFFEAMHTVFTELGPAVLLLENAHRLDETSVALIRYLIRHGQTPLFLIANYTGDHQKVSWLTEFEADEIQRLSLQPLTAVQTGRYLANQLNGPVSESLSAMIYKHSQGNPSFIEEIIQHLLDTGQCRQNKGGQWDYISRPESPELALPSSLFNLFSRRVNQLSEKSKETLAVAAIIGPKFPFDSWLALLGGQPKHSLATAALDEALGLRLVRQTGHNHYFFYPADVARVLASFLPQQRQTELHRQLVDQLLNQPNVDPAVIAHHYQQANQTAEAARYLEMAGDRAAAANAINKAISYYNQALPLSKSQDCYEALGNLYRQQGAADEAIRAFNHALELARQAENHEAQARILNGLSFVLWLYDSYQEADEAAATVLKLPNVSQNQRAIAQTHLGMILWLSGKLMEAEYWCQKAVELLENSRDQASLAGAYSRLGLVHFSRGKYSDAETMFNRSLEIRQQLDDYWGQAYSLNNLGKVATDRGHFEQALSLLQSAQLLFEKIDSNDGLMVVHANQARVLLRQQQVDAALPLLDKALHLAREIGKQSAYGISDIYLLLARANLIKEKLDDAKNLTDQAMHLVEVAGNQQYLAKAHALLAQINAAQNNPAAAEEAYQKAIALFRRVNSRSALLRTQFSYAHFMAGQGQSEKAAKLEQQAKTDAARIGLHL